MLEQVLALYLDAPMQSWGCQSKFDRRTTLSFPTRSGVIGMICAALGIPRSDSDALAEVNALRMTVYSFRQEGRMEDYHTVGGGWDKTRQKQHIVRTASGMTGSTVVTRREYLLSSRFGVLLSGPSLLLERTDQALRDPQWGVWFGRKCCIPASPISHGLFVNEETALRRLREAAKGVSPQRCVVETTRFEEGTDTLMDVPLDFAARTFGPRRIASGPPAEE